jgi:hypothetical protein
MGRVDTRQTLLGAERLRRDCRYEVSKKDGKED